MLNNLVGQAYFLAVSATLISQIPQILAMGLSSYFQFFWLIPIFLIIFDSKFRLNNFLFLIFFILILISLGLFAFHFFGIRPYLDSPHYPNLLKSILILMISYNCSFYLKLNEFSNTLGIISLFFGSVLCLTVYFNSFADGYDIGSGVYAYSAKNSVSQIILTCLIFAVFLYKKIKYNYFYIFIFLFVVLSIYMLFVLKSRATIFGFIIALIYVLIKSGRNKLKLSILTLVSFFVFYLFVDVEFRTLIIRGIVLAGTDGSNLNNSTSGRLDLYADFIAIFSKNIFWGYGFFFIESFPLSLLLDFGIVWSILILFVVMSPFYYIKQFKIIENKELIFVFSLLLIIYFFNALFEQQAPIGPGAKNFFLWSLFGVLLGDLHKVVNIK
jgi:hypothetical protein